MTAREMSSSIAASVRAALVQLPAAVRAELEIAGIEIPALATAIANNAAMAISFAADEDNDS